MHHLINVAPEAERALESVFHPAILRYVGDSPWKLGGRRIGGDKVRERVEGGIP